jgi:hypothetical protein
MMAGKSSLANHLVNVAHGLGWTADRTGFATVLREEIYETVCKQRLMPLGDDFEAQNCCKILASKADPRSELYAKPTPHYIRTLLQYWGTNFRRKQDPDYWVKRFAERRETSLYANASDRLLVVDDVRFPNEISTIRKLGGPIIWLERTVEGQTTGHASENSIGQGDCDYIIESNRPLPEMLLDGERLFLRLLKQGAPSPHAHVVPTGQPQAA